ncbi:hypothetical protein BKA67DRAFT_586074 [Truncatella angustata]|uniref:Uncharacterized protein n=1 Tax=Truncatella angustata TaxID=152316 RepID=A0A9P8UCD9_9PEZI|nr:uncharacterized protein BKA67DRAFT_586074 [Truncatella angustata]KAH6645667.1 hypothetical protein BKA67DRAFT_586074 [Truncatella angustata]
MWRSICTLLCGGLAPCCWRSICILIVAVLYPSAFPRPCGMLTVSRSDSSTPLCSPSSLFKARAFLSWLWNSRIV